jgi:hypothetical protein
LMLPGQVMLMIWIQCRLAVMLDGQWQLGNMEKSLGEKSAMKILWNFLQPSTSRRK